MLPGLTQDCELYIQLPYLYWIIRLPYLFACGNGHSPLIHEVPLPPVEESRGVVRTRLSRAYRLRALGFPPALTRGS